MRIGDTLAGRFVLEHLAGRGGMGEVYRALDQSSGQPVAVKLLLHQEGNQAARFAREMHILAELSHPLIVRHVAHGASSTGEPYLVMEWLDGEDLATRLSRARLGITESVALALQVAQALGVLHERGFVHRDLKPSNIFLVHGRTDQIKLLDLGLVRIDNATRMTGSGTILGTVAYMAPEQARDDQGMNAAADIFALGCVLFECLTGQPAFSAAHATAILVKLLFEASPRLADRLPGAPAALDDLVSRLLAKKPEQRPGNGQIAAAALAKLLAAGLSDAGMPPAIEQERSSMLAMDHVPTAAPPPAPPVSVQGAPTREPPSPSALTDSEQRAAAVILLGTAAAESTAEASDALLASQAAAYGGTFERLMDSSAAVLVSGTQVATDLAAQAARCALALARQAPLRRVALAMGQSGSAGRLTVGPAIDRAARLIDQAWPQPDARPETAQPPLVLIDEVVAGLLDARFDVRNQESGLVLAGEREVAEARTLLGNPTPCVGRERELRMLEQFFETSKAESMAQAVLVTAQPGMGKSRLAHEFLRLIRTRSETAAVWIGRGDSLRAGSALAILGQALRGACRILDGDPLELRRDKVQKAVAERVAESEQARVTQFLGELIGTPLPDEGSLPLRAARGDAQLMSEQMRAAFLDFLAAACARHPVVLVLEDLHWGDRPTVQFIDRALRDLNDRPLFVLALARPEVHEVFPRLWAERQSQELRLAALSRRAIEELARHALKHQVDPSMLDRLIRLSEGNAFYLEELIRWAAEGRGGNLPGTVVAMVQSRLAALDDDARRLLRAASVFGEVFWSGGVGALVGSGERAVAVQDKLAALVERELCTRRSESRFPGHEEYVFRHALVREGAYAMLTDEDRTLGHRLAGAWLERHGEQDALLLAEHFEQGGEAERAGRHYLRAAQQAHATSDSSMAVVYARRELAHPISQELRIKLLGLLCEVHFFQVDALSALPYAEELLQVAPQGQAPWVQGVSIVLVAAMQAGRMEEFSATFHKLLAMEPSPETAAPLAMTISFGVYLFDLLGQVTEADAAMDRMTALMAAFGDHVPYVSLGWNMLLGVRSAYVYEEPAKGLRHCETAIAMAHASGHLRHLRIAERLANMNRWLLGATGAAMSALEQSPVPDDELGGAISSLRPFTLAWLLADDGLMDQARVWAARLVASGVAQRLPLNEGLGRWVLAEVLRRMDEFEAAEAEIQAALAMLGMVSPLDMPGALATLAALRLAQGRPAEALAAAADGLARYESMGACSYFARGAFLRLVHAECLEAAGRHEAACAAIAKARACILMSAQKIGDPAYQQSFLTNVIENRQTLELARQWLDGQNGQAARRQ